MAVPYTFGSATSSIPLSQLDSNFATTITLGNTAVQLGNTVTTLNNMTLANVTISSGNVTISNSTISTSETLSYGTANGVPYLNTSKVVTTGSALTFDGTNLATTGSVNSINTFGFKNRIINGAMVIDQRNAAASQTFTAAAALAYSVDRWYGYCTGANVTGQQVAGANSTQFRYRFTGAASVTAIGFGQRIEQKNCYDLNNSTATLSVDLANSLLTTVTWTASYATTTADTFGTLASPTVTQIATGTFTVTSTVTNYSTQISIPAAATTGIQIVFTVGAQTSGTWTIGNVQLEKGSTATSFDYRPYGTELQLCQRYYQQPIQNLSSGISQGGIATFYALNANEAILNNALPVPMRATPTVTTYGNTGTAGNAFNGSAGSEVTSVTVDRINPYSISRLTKTSGWSTGQLISALFTASAEL